MKTFPFSPKGALYALALLLLLGGALAAQPTVISLQGRLTNATTGAVINAASIMVNISDTQGRTVWNQTFSNGVSNGFFDLLLGTESGNVLSLTFNEDYNISISAGGSVSQIGGTYRFRSGAGQISPSNLSSGDFSAVGNFSFGNALSIDKTNNRVGIGRSSPARGLEVSGDATIYGVLNVTLLNATTGNFSGTVQAARFVGDGSGLTSVIASFTNNTDISVRNFFANNTFFVNGSMVGIGTNAPGGTFEVQPSGTSGFFRVSSSGTSNQVILSTTNGGYIRSANHLIPDTTNSYDLGASVNYWRNLYAQIGYFSSSVGIGTVTPLSTLHVNGTGDNGGFLVTNDSGNSALFVNSTTGRSEFGTISGVSTRGRVSIQEPGNAQIGLYLRAGSNSYGFLLDSGDGSEYIIQGRDINSNVRFNFLANGQATFNTGPLGIGTDAPLSTLHVNGTGAQGGFMVTNDSGFTAFFVNSSNGNVGIGTNAPTSTLEVNGNIEIPSTGYLLVSGQSTLRLGDDEHISFSAGKMYLDYSTGSLGIGTTSPTTNLHVLGSARFVVNDTNNVSTTTVLTLDHFLNNPLNSTGGIGVGLSFRAIDNGSNVDDVAFINATLTNALNGSEASSLGFYTRTGGAALSPALSINGASVGIGTTSPTKKLSVNGTVNALTVDPSAVSPTINTTGSNLTLSSFDGSIIFQLG